MSVQVDPLAEIRVADDPQIEQQIRARTQEDGHERSMVVARKMRAQGYRLIVQRWRETRSGGTMTLVFARNGDAPE